MGKLKFMHSLIAGVQGRVMSTFAVENLLVRINPPKFWSATRLMSNQERDTLLEAIAKMAEAGDVSGLAHFDFITFGKKPDPMAA
jgi:hypothetical protein